MYVGICIEPTLASIGVYDTSSRFNHFEVVAQCPVEIAITEEAGLLLGPEAAIHSGRPNFFDLVALLKTSKSNEAQQVISTYLSHLLRKFEEKKKHKALSGAVFTLTFHTGSATRERLLKAAELAGLAQVWILPAPIAIAVGSTIKDASSGDVTVLRRPRTLFVCYYSKLSFTLSTVEINKDGGLRMGKTLAMENLPEGSDGNFVLAHAQTFSNAAMADNNSQYWVYQAYQKAVRQVLEGYKITDFASFVVATTTRSKTSFKIENMLRDALKRPVLRNVDTEQGALKGVAWVASSLSKGGAEDGAGMARVLNAQCLHFDAASSLRGFRLVMNGQCYFKTADANSNCNVNNNGVNCKLTESILLFSFPFNVKGKGRIVIQLEEQVAEQVFVHVAEYCLLFDCPQDNTINSYGLSLDCVCSYNGVFSLKVVQKTGGVKVELKKVD